jgi:hypothetical protein
VSAHRVNTYPRVGRIDQLQHPESLLLDEVTGLLAKLVICQSLALDPHTLVATPEVAVDAVLAANAGDVNRNNHKHVVAE